jgi:hypothetical protein
MREPAAPGVPELADSWPFTQIFAFVNVAVFLLLILMEVMRFWALGLAVVVSVPVYFHSEACLARAVAANSGPVSLVWDALVGFSLTNLGFSLCHTTIKPDLSPISCYLFAIFQSALIFNFACAVKLLLVGTGIVRVASIRRGFFGVFQRAFIACRNIMMIPIFIGCFLGIPAPTVSDMLDHWSVPSITYISLKCLWQAWLLRDFAITFRKFCHNASAQLTDVPPEEATEDCIVCLDRPTRPVKLPCGHVFCRECAYRWLCERGECPLCSQKTLEFQRIDFFDGRTPCSTLLLSF